MLENEKSAIKSRVRDNFSVTSILIIIANSGVTENSSRAKFDSGFLSSQQPLHRLSAVPLPLHGAGKRAYRFYMYYQLNSIIKLSTTKLNLITLLTYECNSALLRTYA